MEKLGSNTFGLNVVERIATLKAASGEVREQFPKAYEAYHAALKALWSGQFQLAATRASALIDDDPEGPLRFAAYRLWIEALAEHKERPSLAILAEHLFHRGQAEPDDQARYLALRGLIDLELDSIDAARLRLRAIKDNWDDAYALEFQQIFEYRVLGGEHGEYGPCLLRSKAGIVDYLHWQTLARGMLTEMRIGNEDRREVLDEIFAVVRDHFRGAPLPSLFTYHRLISSRDFAAAAFVAGELSRSYPESTDYLYYHAYAHFEDGGYREAQQVLQKTLGFAGDADAEVMSLMGHCSAKLGEIERAKHYLGQAARLLKEQGLPYAHVELELSDIEEERQLGEAAKRAGNGSATTSPEGDKDRGVWLVELSPRRYHEMLTETDEALSQLLRPMGIGARPGDTCYFGRRFAVDGGEEVWKIIADYDVASSPEWHPQHQYQTELRLTARYDVGVRVPGLTPISGKTSATERFYHDLHAKLGVYQLDAHGVAAIAQALHEHHADSFTERRFDGGATRTDVG